MSFFRFSCLTSTAFLLLHYPALAQELEEVIVTGSPLGRSAFDLAQPVSALSGTPLKLKLGPTLGETLSGEPGVRASSYTAGASRPIIRGLADNRVLVLQNGTDVADVSNLSPDHNPSLQPLNAQSIEVMRGAATILYGSSAIGGVVNVLDRRIPTSVPVNPVAGEINGRFTSATLERSGAASFDVRASDHLVFHLDGTLLRTDNLRVPGHAFSERLRQDFDEIRRERGNQFGGDPEHLVPNTSIKSQDFGLGASYVWEKGFLGFAFSQYLAEYGVPEGGDPIEDPEEFPERTKLDMRKRRYEVRSSLQEPLPDIEGANFRLAYTEYKHNELDDNLVGSTFKTHGLEARLELVHRPIGRLEGSVGVQGSYRTLGVYGDEAFLRPNQTIQAAVFAFEELSVQPLRFQLGVRVEYDRVHLSSGEPVTTSEFVPVSGALGVIYDFAPAANVALTVRYSERAPTPEELHANGPHDATFQFLLGDPGLPLESVLGLDLSWRKTAGFITGSVSIFYNHFLDFIDFQETGAVEDDLEVFRYAGKRADFLGGEAQVALHLLPRSISAPSPKGDGGSVKEIVAKEVAVGEVANPHDLFLELNADYVRAQNLTDDEPLGRIPPLRFGGALEYQSGFLGARVEVLRVEEQTRHARFETGTEGYTFLNASLTYSLDRGPLHYDFYVRGTNLTDETARDHTSFLKDVLPLPGRSVMAGLRVSF